MKIDDGSINSLNVVAIRVLIEIDIRLQLKQVLVLNGHDELPTFLIYKNLFEVCFYIRRRADKKRGCDLENLEVSWFLVNKMFEDEQNVLPPGVKDDGERMTAPTSVRQTKRKKKAKTEGAGNSKMVGDKKLCQS